MKARTWRVGPYAVRTAPGLSIVRLPCGTMVRARPNADSAASAAALGYGEDVAGMVEDHDLAHVQMCVGLGVESQSLRQAAGLPHDPRLAELEEAAVCAVTRWARAAGRA